MYDLNSLAGFFFLYYNKCNCISSTIGGTSALPVRVYGESKFPLHRRLTAGSIVQWPAGGAAAWCVSISISSSAPWWLESVSEGDRHPLREKMCVYNRITKCHGCQTDIYCHKYTFGLNIKAVKATLFTDKLTNCKVFFVFFNVAKIKPHVDNDASKLWFRSSNAENCRKNRHNPV